MFIDNVYLLPKPCFHNNIETLSAIQCHVNAGSSPRSAQIILCIENSQVQSVKRNYTMHRRYLLNWQISFTCVFITVVPPSPVYCDVGSCIVAHKSHSMLSELYVLPAVLLCYIRDSQVCVAITEHI